MKRTRTSIKSDDQLGTIKAVAEYLGVGRTWLSGVKRRQFQLHVELGAGSYPIAFSGGKTCAAWVKEFLRHPINASFVPTKSYRTAQQ